MESLAALTDMPTTATDRTRATMSDSCTPRPRCEALVASVIEKITATASASIN